MKHLVSTAIVAVVVSLLTVTAVGVIAQEPAAVAPAAVSSINADKVDGRHAVGAGASKKKRRNKLVATDKNGLLPSNIVKPFWSKIRDLPAGFADGVDNQGVTKITITEESSGTTINTGSTKNAEATCPAGSKPTGGGYLLSRSSDFTLVVSGPTRDGWFVRGSYDGEFSGIIMTAYVLCLSTTPSAAIATS